jgi:ketosteroid isomerase-like protein
MSEPEAAVVRAFFEHLDAGRLDDSLALLHPDIVIVVPPSMSAEPDTYRGLRGAQHYMDGFQGLMEDVRFAPRTIVVEDGRLLAEFTLSARGSHSGIEITQAGVGVIWVEDERIIRIESYPDLDTARAETRGR